jgi:hypothetical protein
MFLSEPLQCQDGRRQVTGRMAEPTYRRKKMHHVFLSLLMNDQTSDHMS